MSAFPAPRFAFFGTPDIGVWVLNALERAGFIPTLCVTGEDARSGRKLILTPPPVKIWATERRIPVVQPTTLKDKRFLQEIGKDRYDLFIVAAYGKIIPEALLRVPSFGTLNVHPSLLPKLRGASPIRSAILTGEKETGVTIMLMDEKMDHGPILAQETVGGSERLYGRELDQIFARTGGELLSRVIPKWIHGEITPREQTHAQATFSKKIVKEDGELDLTLPAEEIVRRVRAYDGWPGTFFWHQQKEKKIRIKVTRASLNLDGTLRIEKVIPEGKKEMMYEEWKNRLA